MASVEDIKIAQILTKAGMGLLPEVNSAIQIRALLNSAGMTLVDTPRVDVSKTKQGRRFRVHIGGHDPRVPTVIGAATEFSIFAKLNAAGCKDILVEELQAGEAHPFHALGNMSGRGVGQRAFFIEFFN